MIWYVAFFKDLTVQHTHLLYYVVISQAALYIAPNPVFHEKTKHIELDCHCVRERIRDGLVKINVVNFVQVIVLVCQLKCFGTNLL